MIGKPEFTPASEEDKAQFAADSIATALELEQTEEVQERISRNAAHLKRVIARLNVSNAKRAEYEKLIADHLVN